MSKNIIKIGIIGAGSIGSLFGGYLAHLIHLKPKSYDITAIFFGREKHINAINENGLSIIKNSETIKVDNIQGYSSFDQYQKQNDKKFTYLFLTTKSYDNKKAIKVYEDIIKEADWFVIIQNGIGNEQLIKNYISKKKIIRVTTSNGALLFAPGQVKHTGEGFTKIGYPFFTDKEVQNQPKRRLSGLQVLKEMFVEAGIETIISDNIVRECWEKVFINIGINPFGALTRLRNGDLLKNKRIKAIMGEAVEEAVRVAKLKNITLTEKDYTALTYDVAEKTAENKNSMLQDILKGKKTEIDFMNGRIVKYAEQLGVEVPINKTIYSLIKGLES
jgi:2-dehydropantoate 2-reductase